MKLLSDAGMFDTVKEKFPKNVVPAVMPVLPMLNERSNRYLVVMPEGWLPGVTIR